MRQFNSKTLAGFLGSIIVASFITIHGQGWAQTGVQSHTIANPGVATRDVPRNSAIVDFQSRSATEGDAFCVYNDQDGGCTRCPGTTDPCTGSSQPSASACFASPDCPDAGSAQLVTTNTLAAGRRGETESDSCVYNATQGTCFAVKINEDGSGTTGVPASVPDAAACADHCANN